MNVMSGRILYFFSKHFLSRLTDFDYALIKGEVLSELAYGKEGRRYTTDIDILTTRENTSKIEKLLIEEGFKQKDSSRKSRIFCFQNSHQISPYIKRDDIFEICIDINFDVFWGEYEGKRINISSFLSDTIELDVYGCNVKSLSILKVFLQLILHHYKDMNSLFLLATRKSIKYDMFKDVYYLLKNNLDTISLDKLYAMSAEYEIITYVFYVLYYTGQVFDDDILKQYIEAFRTPEGEALLNCYGLCEKERREWKCDFKARLDSDHLYDLIKEDLTERDKEKIAVNKRIFLGISE